MDIPNLIRSIIFLVPGLALIFSPDKVYRFQTYLGKILHLRWDFEKERKHYPTLGVAFLIISTALFVYALFR